MYFEIYKQGILIKRGDKTLNNLSFENELMITPTMQLTLPIEYLNYLSGWEHVKVFVNDKCFWGIVKSINVDKVKETIDIEVAHHIDEWNNRQISINNAISDKKLNVIYKPDQNGAFTVRNINNNEELVGTKLILKYSDFKGKSVEYINDYIKSTSSVKAYNMSTLDSLPVHFISSNITVQALKTDGMTITVKQGTYYAIFATEKGSTIKIPVVVSYAAQNSGNSGETDIDSGDPTIEDGIEKILNDDNFVYYEWNIEYEQGVGDTRISYVYSKQSKYEALNQTVELTEDLFWRVGFWNNKTLQIGKFGEQKPYILSVQPPSSQNIQILEEPKIKYDFENVINITTVISEKSDSGASALTLRDLYNMQNDTYLQNSYPEIWEELRALIKKFPIVIIRDSKYSNVNTERNYNSTIGGRYTVDIFTHQSPSVAPNTSREYAIIDVDSVASEGGTIIEGSYSFNDLEPTTEVDYDEDGATKKISNKERLNTELVVYKTAIRKMKQTRRSCSVDILTSMIPSDVNVGDKVRLVYNNQLWNLENCSNYWKRMLTIDDWYYITKIGYEIDGNTVYKEPSSNAEYYKETNQITLSKVLKIDREIEYGY